VPARDRSKLVGREEINGWEFFFTGDCEEGFCIRKVFPQTLGYHVKEGVFHKLIPVKPVGLKVEGAPYTISVSEKLSMFKSAA